jgi:spore coat protein A
MLTLGGLSLGVVAMPQLLRPSKGGTDATVPAGGIAPAAQTAVGVRPQVAAFTRAMPVAPVLAPVASGSNCDVYQLAVQAATEEIIPGVQTPVLTYGGKFLAPTIRAKTGRRTLVSVTNNLTEPVNTHLHGGHTAAAMDGYPMDLVQPGNSRMYDYGNGQQGATLWYHDHSHHTEAEHTFRGLHGAYIIEDPAEQSLNLPSGAYDVPILLRDVEFDADGNLLFFDDPANRTTVLANGVPQPYFQVAARKYRFRLICSANERVFKLSLNNNGKLVQIGSDGGLLPAPVRLDQLVLGSAERADVVIDFSSFPVGSQVVLSDAAAGPILRFDVTRTAPDSSRVPNTLRALPVLPAGTVQRSVDLSFDPGDGTGMPTGLVNGKTFDENRVDIKVKRGDTEIWTVTSSDPPGTPHTFHLHLVQFQVLERNGKAPLPEDRGLKDTVGFVAGETIKLKARFTDELGKYVYHCHYLEHSQLGMMAQLEIVP